MQKLSSENTYSAQIVEVKVINNRLPTSSRPGHLSEGHRTIKDNQRQHKRNLSLIHLCSSADSYQVESVRNLLADSFDAQEPSLVTVRGESEGYTIGVKGLAGGGLADVGIDITRLGRNIPEYFPQSFTGKQFPRGVLVAKKISRLCAWWKITPRYRTSLQFQPRQLFLLYLFIMINSWWGVKFVYVSASHGQTISYLYNIQCCLVRPCLPTLFLILTPYFYEDFRRSTLVTDFTRNSWALRCELFNFTGHLIFSFH